MKCKLALVAKDVIIAHDTGVPSAISILEGIHAASFPLMVPEICFLTVWAKEKDDAMEHEGYLVVVCGDKELVREKIWIRFGAGLATRNIAMFKGLVVPEPGELKFRCEFKTVSTEYPVAVSALEKPEAVVRS